MDYIQVTGIVNKQGGEEYKDRDGNTQKSKAKQVVTVELLKTVTISCDPGTFKKTGTYMAEVFEKPGASGIYYKLGQILAKDKVKKLMDSIS